MKVLLDTCVWGGALGQIRSAGHDAVWAGTGKKTRAMKKFWQERTAKVEY